VKDDYVTRLGLALREAADREERRRAPARAVATAWATLPRLQASPALAALVAGIVLVAAVYGVTNLRSEQTVPAGPKVVARVSPAGGLDMVVPGFGSAWLTDTDSQTLLRMDPDTRRVTARIPLNGIMAIAPGKDALWVGLTKDNEFRLLRIDPRTNRIVARLRMPDVPGGWGGGGGPVIVDGNLWVLSAEAAVRIDQTSGRATAKVQTARDGYRTRSLAVAGGNLWVQVSDGRLLRLDGATGKREATFHVPDGSVIGDFAMNGLFLVDQGSLARVNPRNLHELWRTPIPSIGPGVAADGRLWVETTGRRGDRILTVDPRNGGVIDSVDVGEFGAQWMGPVGSEVWMTTAGGHVVILRR
jgi:outer membrane protein assembly factor BamB